MCSCGYALSLLQGAVGLCRACVTRTLAARPLRCSGRVLGDAGPQHTRFQQVSSAPRAAPSRCAAVFRPRGVPWRPVPHASSRAPRAAGARNPAPRRTVARPALSNLAAAGRHNPGLRTPASAAARRYAKSQKAQLLGQAWGLPPCMVGRPLCALHPLACRRLGGPKRAQTALFERYPMLGAACGAAAQPQLQLPRPYSYPPPQTHTHARRAGRRCSRSWAWR